MRYRVIGNPEGMRWIDDTTHMLLGFYRLYVWGLAPERTSRRHSYQPDPDNIRCWVISIDSIGNKVSRQAIAVHRNGGDTKPFRYFGAPWKRVMESEETRHPLCFSGPTSGEDFATFRFQDERDVRINGCSIEPKQRHVIHTQSCRCPYIYTVLSIHQPEILSSGMKAKQKKNQRNQQPNH